LSNYGRTVLIRLQYFSIFSFFFSRQAPYCYRHCSRMWRPCACNSHYNGLQTQKEGT